MKIQNYGDWEGDKPRGHHPPACTCYRCNEERLAKEAAKEEERRAAEYDRRVAQSQTRDRPPVQQPAEEEERPASESQARDRPPVQQPAHPYTCTCNSCGEAREQQYREARGAARQAEKYRAVHNPSIEGSPSDRSSSNRQLSSQRPSVPSRAGQRRPPRREGSSRAALLWLLLIGVIVGVAVAALYFSNPWSVQPVRGRKSYRGSSPAPDRRGSPRRFRHQSKRPLPTPTTPTPSPEPPPLIAYRDWKLDCPGCPVVALDTREPEVVGAADLQAR